MTLPPTETTSENPPATTNSPVREPLDKALDTTTPAAGHNHEHEADGDGGVVESLQADCDKMVHHLIALEHEERDLDCQVKLLAQQALERGMDVTVVEALPPVKRRKATPKIGDATSPPTKESSLPSSTTPTPITSSKKEANEPETNVSTG